MVFMTLVILPPFGLVAPFPFVATAIHLPTYVANSFS
jgi:hypothetical protein